jgi:hypothetical protein
MEVGTDVGDAQQTQPTLLTYLRSWALIEKLPIVQSLKLFPAFYKTRRFITVFTRALHWSLSWARSIQSIPSHPISLSSILILSTPTQPTYEMKRELTNITDIVSSIWVSLSPGGLKQQSKFENSRIYQMLYCRFNLLDRLECRKAAYFGNS